ncbi:MAG: hypothetical protein WBO12_03550 [Xanthobacteraceae bacterium]
MRSRIGYRWCILLLAMLICEHFSPTRSFAQSASPVTQAQTQQTGSAPPPTDTPPPPAKQNFGGLSFGVGLGLTLNVQNTSRVSQASVINGIVRVTQTDDAIAGIVLESHYFFVPSRPFLWSNVPAGAWGRGPFVAIQASTGGSSSVVTAYGLGWMIGFREPTWTYTNGGWTASYGSSSWNFGVGLRVDPQAQVLGDGIVANQPLPAGETSVRFKTVPRYGIMLVSSFSF